MRRGPGQTVLQQQRLCSKRVDCCTTLRFESPSDHCRPSSFSCRVPAHVKVNPTKFDCSCTIPYDPDYADCCAPEVRPSCTRQAALLHDSTVEEHRQESSLSTLWSLPVSKASLMTWMTMAWAGQNSDCASKKQHCFVLRHIEPMMSVAILYVTDSGCSTVCCFAHDVFSLGAMSCAVGVLRRRCSTTARRLRGRRGPAEGEY